MAIGDQYRVEISYQLYEEILGLNLFYVESEPADDQIAAKNLAKGVAAVIATPATWNNQFSDDMRWTSVNAVCSSSPTIPPYEEPMNIVGNQTGKNLPDMFHFTLTTYALDAGGNSISSTHQHPGIMLDDYSQNRISNAKQASLEATFNNFFLTVSGGAGVGEWELHIPHRPGGGALDPRKVTDADVGLLVGSRYDRKPNTPNTGRTKDPVAQLSRLEARRGKLESDLAALDQRIAKSKSQAQKAIA